MIRIEQIVVSPEFAVVLLKKTRTNRPIRRSTVTEYARDMRARRWLLTNQGIALDLDGYVVDGQHRLHAVIEAGVSVVMLLVHGISHEDAIRAVDKGTRRTPGQSLAMSGEANGNQKAATCRGLMILTRKWGLTDKVGHDDLRKIIDEYRSEVEVTAALNSGVPAIMRSVLVVVMRRDPDVGKAMIDGLVHGVGLGVGDPRLLFREWYRKRVGGDSGEVWARSIITADAFVNGDRLERLSARGSNRYQRFRMQHGLDQNSALVAVIQG